VAVVRGDPPAALGGKLVGMKRSTHPMQPLNPQFPGIFGFETDFAGTLHCIPMSVRMKLDQVGIKLSLKQWNRLPEAERQVLIERPCADAAQTRAYRELLVQAIEAHTRSAVEFAPLDESPPWADGSAVPPRLVEWAQGVSVAPPSAAQWSALTPLQRFALFKLTRPGHSNENFIPAMREFSLLP
jgi:hypothetical protein